MGEIAVIGTGFAAGQLTLEACELLQSGRRVLLHTGRCGCADWLRGKGIAFGTLDALYESCEDFDEHARLAAQAVADAASQEDVVYGVFDVRDRSVAALAALRPDVRVVAGPPVEGALLALATGEARFVEASDWENFHPAARECCFIRELDSRELACEVKLRLMEAYPEESGIWLMNAGEAPVKLPLYALDRAARYDHTTCALVPAVNDLMRLERYDFEHLNAIMRLLCAPDGCPWDRVQTHETLRPYILEEAYEVIDAIDAGEADHLYDELGDMLLQVALHAEIARRHGEFDISDVTTAICEKMIHRHSHVFGSDRVEDADAVIGLWNRNKMAERGQTTRSEVLRSVTRTLPALLRAVKVLKRSAEVGLGETDPAKGAEACTKRLKQLPEAADAEALLGDALLAMADVARLKKVDPEIALNAAVNRFIDRFERAERELLNNYGNFEGLSPETLQKYWDLVKL